MVNYVHLTISVILFILILIIFSREKMDYVAYSLIFAVIVCIATVELLSIEEIANYLPWLNPDYYDEVSWVRIFINLIEFEPLMFIIGMQLIVAIAEKYNIFQWIAAKSIHITKGNYRAFFYMICTIATITAAIIADVTVAIIFVPLVIGACRSLKIRSAPFLYGISITINIGSVITPFSSSKNILIASEYGLDMVWFLTNLGPFVISVLIITLILLDIFVLSKTEPTDELQKILFLEILNPSIVIVDKKKFRFNSIYFAIIIVLFIIFSDISFLIAFFGGVLMCILNKESFVEVLRRIDLKVISFFIALFLLIGSMELNGVFTLIGVFLSVFDLNNVYFVSIAVLLVSSLFSGFLASNPTAVLLISILRSVFPTGVPDLVIIALILGVNLGGNILPQGATCDLMTLNIAQKMKVRDFNYRSLLKKGGLFALLHIVLCITYITIYSWIIPV